jgi:hypothetical protein
MLNVIQCIFKINNSSWMLQQRYDDITSAAWPANPSEAEFTSEIRGASCLHLVFCELFCRSMFVLFLWATEPAVHHRFTASDYYLWYLRFTTSDYYRWYLRFTASDYYLWYLRFTASDYYLWYLRFTASDYYLWYLRFTASDYYLWYLRFTASDYYLWLLLDSRLLITTFVPLVS